MELNTLIKEITARTGVSEEQAKSTVAIVMDQLKTQLPDPVAAQMDRVLTGHPFEYDEIVKYNWNEWSSKAAHELRELGSKGKDLIDKIF